MESLDAHIGLPPCVKTVHSSQLAVVIGDDVREVSTCAHVSGHSLESRHWAATDTDASGIALCVDHALLLRSNSSDILLE